MLIKYSDGSNYNTKISLISETIGCFCENLFYKKQIKKKFKNIIIFSPLMTQMYLMRI